MEECRKKLEIILDFLVQAENGAKELEKALSALDLDLNTNEAKKALSDIESALYEIDKTDLSGLDKALKGASIMIRLLCGTSGAIRSYFNILISILFLSTY